MDAWVFVDRVMQCVIDYYEGKALEPRVNIPLYVVDKDNVTEFWDFPEE